MVIDWIDGVFPGTEDEMCGLEWGRLYETYHKNAYSPAKVWARVKELYADECVRNRRGIFEYVLGGERELRLLDLRVFESRKTKAVYVKQTAAAEAKGGATTVDNCQMLCKTHNRATGNR